MNQIKCTLCQVYFVRDMLLMYISEKLYIRINACVRLRVQLSLFYYYMHVNDEKRGTVNVQI